MGTLIGTLKRGAEPLQTLVTIISLEGPLPRTGYVQSKADLRTSTSTAGSFSIAVDPGNYRIEWKAGQVLNVGYFAMPDDEDTHDLQDLITSSPAAALDPDVEDALAAATAAAVLGRPKFYDTIEDLLAAAGTVWIQAVTLNSYASDGIVSTWTRILASDPAATGLADNGDTVRETDDGLAFAIRTSVAG